MKSLFNYRKTIIFGIVWSAIRHFAIVLVVISLIVAFIADIYFDYIWVISLSIWMLCVVVEYIFLFTKIYLYIGENPLWRFICLGATFIVADLIGFIWLWKLKTNAIQKGVFNRFVNIFIVTAIFGIICPIFHIVSIIYSIIFYRKIEYKIYKKLFLAGIFVPIMLLIALIMLKNSKFKIIESFDDEFDSSVETIKDNSYNRLPE
ncbi:Uncharacterised protein [Metamycoplasma cloacale]|uniref:Uncharacterized protein n=1 Tax=Metamycoplasma cloacale TaxID=92401 RepID=A0A2Z4LNI5_9BACT|nr:hypothetical protein [Metamycoplasma cloacale]AWX42918.1 hypothetical protein DK849_02515 [Metamycoplasma cloacale]VEU79257.1 Uncharacterised protein [Metamycoplasma cloacale]